jgi:lipase chaperone LimK
MTLDEINDKIESYQKQLDDYNLQIEALSNKEDLNDDDTQAEIDNIMKNIVEIMEALDKLISKIE